MEENRKSQTDSSALIVLGMHRSGTSTLTGVLGLCGAWLGSSEQMTGSNKENIKGFFERRDLRSICDSLLFSTGADWWRVSSFRPEAIPDDALAEQSLNFSRLVDQLSDNGTWAAKEPRLCVLFPALRPHIPDPVCLLPIRNPIEVARSLRTRNQFSILHGIALWELYTRRALLASQDEKRVFVSYAELVADPKNTTTLLLDALQVYGVKGLSMSEEVSTFVSPELRHEVVDESEMEALLDQDQRQLWQNLLDQRDLNAEGQREISKRSALLLKELEYQHQARLELTSDLRDAQSKSVALNKQIAEQDKQVGKAKGDAEALNKQIAERDKQIGKAKSDAEAQRRRLTEINNVFSEIKKHFDTELNVLQLQLTDARYKPMRYLKRKFISHLLYDLKDMKAVFSTQRREKFLRSAQKRDPKRNDVDKLKSSLASLSSEMQPTKLSNSIKNVPDALIPLAPKVPIQWASLAPENPVAVIVPVYNAAEDLEQCIERLAAFTPAGTDILFIDDVSPDPRIKDLLSSATANYGMRVLTNTENMGFTKTINRGLAETSPRDVIILNSDARVTPGWVEGINAAAYSAPKVATVTPMSDRAGAFSAPKIGNENTLPPGVDEITYARAFRRRSLGLYPAVPTGNGFCMYISRACIQEIGLLDEDAFPRGYGEENDFCMRALRAGWKNLIDDRTYVFHARSKSFGASKNDLMAAGRKVIDQRYPEYKLLISAYSESSDIQTARSQAQKAIMDCAEPEASNPRILYVISTVTGGTPQTNLDLMKALSGTVSCFLLRCDSKRLQLWKIIDGHQHLLKEHGLEEVVSSITHMSSEYDAVLSYWLTSLDIDLVHIRHPAWHSLSLAQIAQREGRAVVMSFHDFYTLCPTVKLLDNNNSFCGGTCSNGPGDCRVELWPVGSMPPLKDKWVHVWRKRFEKALANCDAYVTTSNAAREQLIRGLPTLPESRFWTIPHGREFPRMDFIRARPISSEPLRILIPGNINEAKGLDVIHEILAEDTDGMFEFHILGACKQKYGKHERLIQHGTYARAEFAAKVAAIQPHLGAVFSIWDETWCHTLTEMWSVGLPVAVFDFPTVAARMRQAGAGWVLEHHDIPFLCRELNRVGRDPTEFSRTQSAISAWQAGEALAGNTRRMAADYFDIYRQALAHRRSAAEYTAATSVVPQPISTNSAMTSLRTCRVAVVGPSNRSQISANASTEIRLRERTRNTFERDVTYVRLNPDELLASLQTKELDAAILQRTAVPNELVVPLLGAFEETGIPFIFDIDDNLLEVPPFKYPNGEYAAYAPTLRKLIAAATLVTVSTECLKTAFASLAKRIELLPNRLSMRLWRGNNVGRSSDGIVRALYFGTSTHAEDLKLITPALNKIADANPHFRLAVVGVTTGILPSWAERIEVPVDAKSYQRFVPWLRDKASSFDFAIAPLEKSSFNLFKSPLKLLECGALGLPVLASDHPVFQDIGKNAPGVQLVPDGVESWVEAIKAQIVAGRKDGDALRDWVIQHAAMEASLAEFDEMILQIIEAESCVSSSRAQNRTHVASATTIERGISYGCQVL